MTDETPEKYRAEPQKWKQKDWLYEMYWGKLSTTREMAEKCDVSSHRHVREQLVEHGIPRRPRGFAASHSPFTGFYTDEATRDNDPHEHFDQEKVGGEIPEEEIDWSRTPRGTAFAAGDD